MSPPVHVRDRVPAEAVGPVGASKAGGAPHLVSFSVAVPKTPPKAPPATAGRLPPAEGTPVEEPEPQLRSRGSRRPPRRLETPRGLLSSLLDLRRSGS